MLSEPPGLGYDGAMEASDTHKRDSLTTGTPPNVYWAFGLFGLSAQSVVMIVVGFLVQDSGIARFEILAMSFFALPAFPFVALASWSVAARARKDIANLRGVENEDVLRVYRGLVEFVMVGGIVLTFVSVPIGFFFLCFLLFGVPGR